MALTIPHNSTHRVECFDENIFLGLTLDQNLSMSQLGPQSPLEMKPDASQLGQFSPQGPNSPGSFSLGHPSLLSPSPGGGQKPAAYPPNHPLSGSKHLCSICGDRASGKHYGVYRYGHFNKIFLSLRCITVPSLETAVRRLITTNECCSAHRP